MKVWVIDIDNEYLYEECTFVQYVTDRLLGTYAVVLDKDLNEMRVQKYLVSFKPPAKTTDDQKLEKARQKIHDWIDRNLDKEEAYRKPISYINQTYLF